MNVYFCDVCGVRVTDVDLHAGHGMRRRNDVICAACIDLGHGKEWVEAHAQKKAPAMAGAVAGGANGHEAPARPVEIARDRVRTLDEDEPASPVKPVQLPVQPAAVAPTPEFDDTAQVPVVNQELASAAMGFAALTPPKAEKSATDEDDIEELPPPRLDDSGPSAKLEDSKLDDSGPAPVVAATSPFDEGVKIDARADTDADDEDPDAQKSETSVSESSVEESDRPEAKKAPPARKATSSSRVSKAGKGSSRAKRGPKKNSQQQFMLISIASMVLIIIIGSVIIATKGSGSHTGGDKIPVNISSALREAVTKAKSAQKSALGSHDLAKLEAAHADVGEVRNAVSSYERVAHENHFTDDMIENGVSAFGVLDVYSVDRAVRDEIEMVRAQQAH